MVAAALFWFLRLGLIVWESREATSLRFYLWRALIIMLAEITNEGYSILREEPHEELTRLSSYEHDARALTASPDSSGESFVVAYELSCMLPRLSFIL